MAGYATSMNDVAEAILNSLTQYTDEVAEGVHKAVDTTTFEGMFEIRKHIDFGTGKYSKYLEVKESFKSKYNKRNTIFLKNKYGSLAHLIEYGHELRRSEKVRIVTSTRGVIHTKRIVDSTRSLNKRTRAFPHIAFGAELAERRLPELIAKVVQGEKI